VQPFVLWFAECAHTRAQALEDSLAEQGAIQRGSMFLVNAALTRRRTRGKTSGSSTVETTQLFGPSPQDHARKDRESV